MKKSINLRALKENQYEMVGVGDVVIIRLAIYSGFRYVIHTLSEKSAQNGKQSV